MIQELTVQEVSVQELTVQKVSIHELTVQEDAWKRARFCWSRN
jgi:hypothetical protein